MRTKCKMLLKCFIKTSDTVWKGEEQRHKKKLSGNIFLYLGILCSLLLHVRPSFLFYFQAGEAYKICVKVKQRIN